MSSKDKTTASSNPGFMNSEALTTSKRICAICLEDIDRDDYDRHMQEDHGYELLDTTPVIAKNFQ